MTDEAKLNDWKKPNPERETPSENIGVAEQKEQEFPRENTIESTDQKTKEISPGVKPGNQKISRTNVTIPQTRDEVAVRIEKVLENGIGDAYARLSPVAKQEFKIKGEQTAQAIRELLKSSHLQIKKIFRLILDWLKLLPGINHFFLEQEAKIKADNIIAIHEQMNKK